MFKPFIYGRYAEGLSMDYPFATSNFDLIAYGMWNSLLTLPFEPPIILNYPYQAQYLCPALSSAGQSLEVISCIRKVKKTLSG